VQARWQLRCLRIVRAFDQVIAWSPTRAHLDALCDEMRSESMDIHPASSCQEVCERADVLITATPSRTPLVRADWLHEGMHITALGSDSPGKQELDATCLDRADLVVVDRFAQCAAFGELKHALDAGVLTRNDVHELGALVAGRRSGRTSTREITIADLTGVGFQDTAIASAALEWIKGTEDEGRNTK
jgi:ornithine cyclodeaminase